MMAMSVAVLLFSFFESGVSAASEREQIIQLGLENAGLQQALDSARQALSYCRSQLNRH